MPNKQPQENTVQIITVRRNNDGKSYSLYDTATTDGGIFRGQIDGFQQFEDDFRVHLEIDDESADPQYFSLFELD